jgi:hypothetical protein
LYFLTSHLLSVVGASLATAPFSGFARGFFTAGFLTGTLSFAAIAGVTFSTAAFLGAAVFARVGFAASAFFSAQRLRRSLRRTRRASFFFRSLP